MPNTATFLTAREPLFDFLFAVLRSFRQPPVDAQRKSSVTDSSGVLRLALQLAFSSANALLVHTGSQNKRPGQSQQQQEPGSLPSHDGNIFDLLD
jgi:hypothetical protein